MGVLHALGFLHYTLMSSPWDSWNTQEGPLWGLHGVCRIAIWLNCSDNCKRHPGRTVARPSHLSNTWDGEPEVWPIVNIIDVAWVLEWEPEGISFFFSSASFFKATSFSSSAVCLLPGIYPWGLLVTGSSLVPEMTDCTAMNDPAVVDNWPRLSFLVTEGHVYNPQLWTVHLCS